MDHIANTEYMIDGKTFNELNIGKKFIRRTNLSINNNGHFSYDIGTEIHPITFYPSGKCKNGGINFIEFDKINLWLKHKNRVSFSENINGIKSTIDKDVSTLTELIIIPDDANVYINGTIFKTDKFVSIGDIWSNEELCKSIVSENGLALEFVNIKIKTMEMCMLAVLNHSHALKFVESHLQTEEMCKIAIINAYKTKGRCPYSGGFVLRYVYEQTDALCELAVSIDGYALSKVKNQTQTICKIALAQNGYSRQFVKIKIN